MVRLEKVVNKRIIIYSDIVYNESNMSSFINDLTLLRLEAMVYGNKPIHIFVSPLISKSLFDIITRITYDIITKDMNTRVTIHMHKNEIDKSYCVDYDIKVLKQYHMKFNGTRNFSFSRDKNKHKFFRVWYNTCTLCKKPDVQIFWSYTNSLNLLKEDKRYHVLPGFNDCIPEFMPKRVKDIIKKSDRHNNCRFK